MKTIIKYSRWGLANRFGNVVVLNINLMKYPYLHDILLKHELLHERNPLKNIRVDYDSLSNLSIIETIIKLKFMLKYPKSLIQFSPIYIYDRRPYLDLSLMIVYIVIFLILVFY